MLAAVAIGGALGAAARYGVAQLVPLGAGSFPWATWWTNVTGSFVLGVVLMVLLRRFPSDRLARPLLATGFLGAFTTYSTFAVQTVVLVGDGSGVLAGVYVVASLAAGFGAAAAGIAAGRRLAPPLPGRR
ncbi:MAG: fluoride exporter [Actinomycetota bacterium]|nr:fluoride exporter [Actinomycetota bacterium]